MVNHEPCRHEDPIWYDRIEVDEPPGLILDLLAHVFVAIMAGIGAARTLYWLPTQLWCRASRWVLHRRAAAAKRF
ncbi:hypothetical protein ABID82_003878 [Methylobacterium sp. PvP062]|jgi:hypothetical protein|uniref:Uncharacterized protein n=2 Tax=Methylobacterium radiotolerans TaxID=31998 RepID=B1M5S9_METRJ|nr:MULTISPECIES: hypothetical protein [Methylobacterium]MCX7331746.1 hypothetical protein [Hyphomicrobiales bacterium]GAN48550.1 hypothetical protein ME121_2567 [Methylobacterium sp. ME121]ACB26526.1 hypothetical protein Mrad2831_4560 [Methylobacterium radiotolerans JCM 2831]KTS08084.1 hypothetical protein SB3_15850 [Methylobacterium radiotolerans]KTS50989.1 hypothetical protein SB2_00905 [Methylobacterium radiotolerans]